MSEVLNSVKESRVSNGKTTYTIRESYENDESKTLDVREVENGFVVRISHSYYEGKDGNRQWKCDEKEFISKENPLDKIKTQEEDKKEMTSKDIVSSISTFLAGFSNKIMI